MNKPTRRLHGIKAEARDVLSRKKWQSGSKDVDGREAQYIAIGMLYAVQRLEEVWEFIGNEDFAGRCEVIDFMAEVKKRGLE